MALYKSRTFLGGGDFFFEKCDLMGLRFGCEVMVGREKNIRIL